ncbi:homocysteine S-methyltransferase family protein [Cellulosilyticum lentocellum]|uniref:Methionine synthase n=1 Tax=Cellulosilyticum lentocellum (strain ATCC 49066 / DSM 5427 / NCIMB 11756 / RHM5) TaxID=642492 RepID=F2JGX5_CELLD|nr:homocysteine S-methyltransferase family protein [Cellulosilyticum lentocellum]ADZ85315.1 Methionine synthase [Cellulosilyticum lentocellum DSM 5427]
MVCNVLGKRRLYFDGAMGTAVQSRGLKLGEVPELFNITHPEIIEEIHRAYLEAGSNFVTTNTFGANRYKIEEKGYTVEQIISKAVEIAKAAKEDFPDSYIALDIGPSGKVLRPVGDVEFEEVYEIFKEQVIAGEKAGCDVILCETFTDLYELKAAVLAAKENTSLPVFCTMSFEENGRTFFGTSIESMILTLEGLGVSALGVNCSLGPKQLKEIVKRITKLSHIPVMVQPNAGLPVMQGENVHYDITAEEFAEIMKEFAEDGVSILGGCCGTTPEYIEKTVDKTKDIPYELLEREKVTGICSSSEVVYFDDVVVIGERLNPTGKKMLQQALRNHDMDYVLREAIKQQEQGAHILDVNMGLPDIDEVEMLKQAVVEVQSIVGLPLQIDSSNVDALEAAVRIYNGKPLINSVNGKKESLEAVLPIAKRYGACILGLTLDEKGIPETAEERLIVAKRIVDAAVREGIPKEDIFIDCLVVTASAQQSLVKETLKAVRLVKEELGVKTILGVSNVSFGLPQRPIINKTMLAMALIEGLDAPIMNPGDAGMMEAISAYRVLMGKDQDSKAYIDKYSGENSSIGAAMSNVIHNETIMSMNLAIKKGLKEEAKTVTLELMKEKSPLEMIELDIIPALNEVGKLYETGVIFLPQLIKSAEAAKAAFEILQVEMSKQNVEARTTKTKVVLATVYGDIHDIGKNIVKVIMENYNFEVIDLGKDVPSERVIEAVKKHEVRIVGLSALMTTTVNSMKDTITLLRKECEEVKVIVGGAVLTPELAQYVGADYFAKDAMETVRIASSL